MRKINYWKKAKTIQTFARSHHSHGDGDAHEAEGEEDDDVPVLAVLHQDVRPPLQRLRQCAGVDFTKYFRP
jgi:hypothetical protein